MNSRLLLPTGLFPILEKVNSPLDVLCASVILALLAVVEIEKKKRTAPGSKAVLRVGIKNCEITINIMSIQSKKVRWIQI